MINPSILVQDLYNFHYTIGPQSFGDTNNWMKISFICKSVNLGKVNFP